jgi:putative glutamine amidotransferase
MLLWRREILRHFDRFTEEDNMSENPLIGITTFRSNTNGKKLLVSVGDSYISAVVAAGGTPILIPVGLPHNILQIIIAKLDGILLTGGGDIHPERYGKHTPSTNISQDIDEDRDQLEFYLIDQVLETDKPLLGICRGLQVMNVAMGGTLYEDIKSMRNHSYEHQYSGKKPRDYEAHAVDVLQGSLLNSITKTDHLRVNSLHHQGIHLTAPKLSVSAIAEDGLVEAVELPDHRFALAVQWHPEDLRDKPAMAAIFKAFVDAAKS